MSIFAAAAAALAITGGAIGGAASAASLRVWGPKSLRSVAPPSARRIRALAAIDEVVPSKYGDARFAKLAPGYAAAPGPDGGWVLTANGTRLPDGLTTCGYLPCYVGRALGDPRGITSCGLESARARAKEDGAWVQAGGAARPRPGDVLLYVNDQDTPVHVGMFVGMNADGTWRTADAGQGGRGDGQEAKYLDRKYDPAAVALSSPAAGGAGRRLAGWLDLDKLKLHDVTAVSGVVVDVRSPREYAAGHLPGAVNVPVDGIAVDNTVDEDLAGKEKLDKTRQVFVYCGSGKRSARAAAHLAGRGYRVTDIGAWRPARGREFS